MERLSETVSKLWEGILSKFGEKIADTVADKGGSIAEFHAELDHLGRNAKQLSNVRSDIETRVKNEERSGGKKRKREVSEWLNAEVEIQKDVRALQTEVKKRVLRSRFTCVGRVGNLNKRVKEHMEQRKHFRELVFEDFGRREMKLLAGRIYGAGLRTKLTAISNCLAARNAQIIGIHGGPRTGKTLLAKHVHNQILQESQNHVYWVVVSENTSTEKLQDDISHAICLNLSDDNNVDVRAAKLNHALKQSGDFVLILDNLKERIDLERVGILCQEDGCRLIITTPELEVCRNMDRIFQLKVDEDEAWNIFKEAYGQDVVISSQQEGLLRSKVNELLDSPEQIIDFAREKRREVSPSSSDGQQAGVQQFH